jgi:ATP-dependent DNA helicase RecQ
MLEELETVHKSQYPSLEYIRKIYQGLANYLQVPLGTEQVGYDFNLNDFLKKFSFQTKPAQAALQVLQQEGFITLNDPVFIPSTLYFICDRNRLNQLETENPALDHLSKTLLRTYAGIYDQPVAIHEKLLASLMKISPEELGKGLNQLRNLEFVEYNPQKEIPQVYFNLPRRKSSDIRIDEKAYGFRKEQFVKRVQGMLSYVRTADCRNTAIAAYFGEENAEKCGICDNCVKKEKEVLSTAEFEYIYQKLREGTRLHALTAPALFDQFSDIHAEHLRKVIDFVVAENRLQVDEAGIVHIS